MIFVFHSRRPFTESRKIYAKGAGINISRIHTRVKKRAKMSAGGQGGARDKNERRETRARETETSHTRASGEWGERKKL